MTSKTVRSKKYKIVSVDFERYKSYDFVTDKYLDEYLEGEEIDIPGYDKATFVGTREGTLKYDVFYPHFYFTHYYKTVGGVDIEPDSYVVNDKTEAFEEQRRADYKRYKFLKDFCKKAEKNYGSETTKKEVFDLFFFSFYIALVSQKVRKTPIFRKDNFLKESILETPKSLVAIGFSSDRYVKKLSEKRPGSSSQHLKCVIFV